MSRIFLSVLAFWVTSLIAVKAQVIVGGTNINNLDIQYIELIGYNRSTSEAIVWIDFGQNYDGSKSSEFLKPANGQEGIRFTSVVEALNYVYKNGWELVEMYIPSPNASRHYVLQRKNQSNKRVN